MKNVPFLIISYRNLFRKKTKDLFWHVEEYVIASFSYEDKKIIKQHQPLTLFIRFCYVRIEKNVVVKSNCFSCKKLCVTCIK